MSTTQRELNPYAPPTHQVVRAWIQSKNSLVKHFEDMRFYRPFKEYLQVKLVSMVDDEGRSR
ncbi:hypothetical protein Tco_0441608, partial [Tanacetum coccineum]